MAAGSVRAAHSVSSRGIIRSTRRFLARPSGRRVVGDRFVLALALDRDPRWIADLRRHHLLDRLGARHGQVVVGFEGARLARLHIVGVADDPDRSGSGSSAAAMRPRPDRIRPSCRPSRTANSIRLLTSTTMNSPFVSTVRPPRLRCPAPGLRGCVRSVRWRRGFDFLG